MKVRYLLLSSFLLLALVFHSALAFSAFKSIAVAVSPRDRFWKVDCRFALQRIAPEN